MTGWGQKGPLANRAGHDINYNALAGALHLLDPARGSPTMPVNLLGGFGGGGVLLASGIVSVILEARSSGLGQFVDAPTGRHSATDHHPPRHAGTGTWARSVRDDHAGWRRSLLRCLRMRGR
jgi:crotonobetainyl-CoA:carnitine CoA-transferase CaiB-like acyl-CoA transferase